MTRFAWLPALAVFAIALGLRLVHLWQLRRAPFFSLLMGDALSYDAWAQRIASGDWLGREVFYQAPLYPYLLGMLYAVFGHSQDVMAARVAQIVLGSVACALVTLAGERLFNQRAGVIAGLLLAVYGPAIFFDGLIQKATLDLLFLSGLLLIAAILIERVTFTRALAAGIVLGCLALTRENALVLLPPLLAWIAWLAWQQQHPRQLEKQETQLPSPSQRQRSQSQRKQSQPERQRPPRQPSPSPRSRLFVSAGALLLGVGIILMPVALRNLAVGGELHLTTSQGGPNFYIGNHDGATGTYEPLRSARGSAAYERQDAIDLAQRALGRSLGPREVSDYWWQRAFQWIAAHPAQFLALTTKKLLLTWNAEEAPDTEDLYSHADWSLPLKMGTTLFHFGLLAPLGVFGIWLTRARWRELWGLYAMMAIYTVSVALFFVLARYRYPLVPFLVLFAGAAIADLPTWWRSSTVREKWQAAIIVAFVAIACNWPLLSAAETRAVTHYNIGYEFQTRGQIEEAIAEYRVALALVPGYALAHSNLGVLLAAQGQREEARAHYREALRLDPALVEALVNLGINLAESGQPADAIDTLRRAIALDPTNVNAHYNLGTALAAIDRVDEARREFEQTLTLDPKNAAAHNNLGILFASAGRLDEGIAHFRAALALRPEYPEAAANLQRALAMAR